ncbi:hypothetical protein DY000_02027817 [Brassica cretica]|uniref:GH3 C-terminal domain-containing protein n=1 Tax=Brassica cretica TaxID=69181 RepID=A0ABQ7EIV2_BRACR|nr:hypothetical protein DY000_02027817 [Brassica cretica]
MCNNIRSGELSDDWITDLSCRESVSKVLGGPNPQLADLIEDICNQKSWKGGYYELIVTSYSDVMLRAFTCYPHISAIPGHYVLYWELKGNRNGDISELIDTNVLVECCSVVEESLDALYRKYRSKFGSIGALEIRVVQQGTFDSLMEYFIAQGASIGQYKTPRCIKSSEALEVLENRVTARFFISDKLPHVNTLLCVNGGLTSIFS